MIYSIRPQHATTFVENSAEVLSDAGTVAPQQTHHSFCDLVVPCFLRNFFEPSRACLVQDRLLVLIEDLLPC